jgi:hypothetical protein
MTHTDLSFLVFFSTALREWAQEDHERLCCAPPAVLCDILDMLGDPPCDGVIFTEDELRIRTNAFRALNRILILAIGGRDDHLRT